MIGIQVQNHKVRKAEGFSFDGSNNSALYSVYCALIDIYEGLKTIPRSYKLASFEVKRMYSRTVIGPWWIVIQDVAYILGLGLLWSVLLTETAPDFLAHFATGYVAFSLMTALLLSGASAFTSLAQSTSRIDSNLSPISWFTVFRTFFVFLHSLVALMIVLVINGYTFTFISATHLTAFLALLLVNGFFLSLWTGALTSRFRDLQPIIELFTRILFFLTPIFWTPESVAGTPLENITRINPFYYLIETFRSIVLSKPLSEDMVYAVGVITLVNASLGILVFAFFRKQIPMLVKV